jgi:hypothetical protein
METLKTKLSSRKFWAAFLGALLPPVLAFLGEEFAFLISSVKVMLMQPKRKL